MRVSSIRWGIIWIGIGFLFLAINFEVLDSLVFPTLFSLWPVLLIAIGVELIFRKTRLYFLALLSPLIIAGAFIFAATYGSGYSWSFNEFWKDWSWGYEGRKEFSRVIPADPDVDTVHVLMNIGDSEFKLRPYSAGMFSLETSYQKRSPQITFRTEETSAYIEYTNREKSIMSIFKISNHGLNSDVGIADDLVLYAEISVEGPEPNIDFSDFKLIDLKLFLDSKEASIRIGDRLDRVKIDISGKSSELYLSLPLKFGIEIRGNRNVIEKITGIENIVFFSEGLRSKDFDKAQNKMTVSLKGDFKTFEIHHSQ